MAKTDPTTIVKTTSSETANESEIRRIEAEIRCYRRQCEALGIRANTAVIERLEAELSALTSAKPTGFPTRIVRTRIPATASTSAPSSSHSSTLSHQGTINTMSDSPSLTDRVKREIFEIEKRTDLTTEEKVSRITHITCATCAGIAIQPIPFADIFILTPVQAFR